MFWKACSYSYQNIVVFYLNNLKKGRHLLVHLEMNLFKAVILLFICCTPFRSEGDFMSTRAFILLGLASMPRVEIKYPKNFPELMPNTHFLGFKLIM